MVGSDSPCPTCWPMTFPKEDCAKLHSTSSVIVASFGTFGRSWSATARHCADAASRVSWARAVAMKAETTLRPLLLAVQVADSSLVAAALRLSCASETTSLTPRRQRRVLGPDRLSLSSTRANADRRALHKGHQNWTAIF